ncbi:hypothetical protein SAMN02745170_00791 [Propionispora hippei DSM 15287]|uniref:Uncharacterized protein n=1 Tax=Propionispora hippei DSM 15287 TaxID=1123003 RepID=A0A1M6CZJ6_9FIRM|nr:hypothetical protein SAMN02745170_00791 [Propionispora hippei DSM 15287]
MSLKVVVLMVLFLLVLLTSACWAEENPFANVAEPKDVIDKAFAGRKLDPLEGMG